MNANINVPIALDMDVDGVGDVNMGKKGLKAKVVDVGLSFGMSMDKGKRCAAKDTMDGC